MMPKVLYTSKKFQPASLATIRTAVRICEEYDAQGLVLTLRQLYYQFVARDLLPNRQSEYKRLGSLLNDARMAGLMDWNHLIDRTRNLQSQSHWSSPADIIRSAAAGYNTDKWAPQHKRVEVWIEKDAGIGVIEGVCDTNDVPYFSCRGYTSVSELWAAGQRLGKYIALGDAITVLHIGDHDPSGLDMSRDIEDRVRRFIVQDWYNRPAYDGDSKYGAITDDMNNHVDGTAFTVKRIALNYDQVLQYNPPPNPAKTTDARYRRYVDETGLDESWELDALDPSVLRDLIQDEIDELVDEDVRDDAQAAEDHDRELLDATVSRWSEIVELLS